METLQEKKPQAHQGITALIQEMGQSLPAEDSTTEQKEREAQALQRAEKEREANEAIKPLLEARSGLVDTRQFLQGGRLYFAIKDKAVEYSTWLDETKEVIGREKQVLDQAAEKYKSITGEEPTWKNALGWISSDLPESLLTEDPAKALERERQQLKEQGSSVRTKEFVVPKNAAELLAKKIDDYKFYAPDSRPVRTIQLVRGMGYAALQAKDIDVAAKALAFSESESVEPASEEMVKHAGRLLDQLSEAEKRSYIAAWGKEQR